ncbi:B-cell scaffold protein with ankyrin repeats-like isoform X2 [Chelmon rostratus]|uniref:B-cell scaffold protein with ankyrin repeats-like isoform X2 n=1 Tax=Chelmon rostratus TaxID=109905 RepID=UPI001BE8D654|nr:B-cell scaffold protein with ankyrin repeats-like isoform X2 [Chelmon rostratus]
MSQTAEELLIIYETEAEQWATYLHSVFNGHISEAGICCYDIATASSRRDDFLRLASFTCKLLILSKGMLEGLCQMRRFFLARVLSPAAHVVVLLCGVESLTPLLELVPLNGDECLQISSEQDADEYLSTVTDIVKKGLSAPAANVNPAARKLSGAEHRAEQTQSTGAPSVRPNIEVVPSRVLCGSSTELFILLKNEAADSDAEVEFAGENQELRVRPVRWNERILCINAPDFPAGNVSVTVYNNGVPLSKAQLQYYSNMEEITCLLARAADPVEFMCQALQESSVEKLDQKLSSMLLEGMPTGGFQGLQSENTPERELHHADVPSLLHFAAQYGFKSVSSLLLQCPGAERALHTANRHGQTPTEIAKSHGHTELHVLLKETLKVFNSGEDNGDASVYEMMCTAVFQKKKTPQADADLYSLPTKQARGREDRTSCTYDTFEASPTHGLQQLIELQQRVKAGSLSVDGALERFGDWQRVQKGADATQQDRLSQLRASIINSREDDDSVYDKINIVHHTPSLAVNESRRGSQAAESDFYSKPLKGQHSNFFSKADKR